MVTYSSFRADLPPGDDGRILGKRTDGLRHACTNPADLSGGEGELDAFLLSVWRDTDGQPAPQEPWTTTGASIATNWVKVLGLLHARCAEGPNGAYLSITTLGDPSDARVDRVEGDVEVGGQVQAQWGLHMIDVELAMGNLVALVRAQAAAWLDSR